MTLKTVYAAVKGFWFPLSVSDDWLMAQRLADSKKGWEDAPNWTFPEDVSPRRAEIVPIGRGRTR